MTAVLPKGFATPENIAALREQLARPDGVIQIADAASGVAIVGWQPMETAPRGKRLLGVVDGDVRFIMWTKTSHIPLYGWQLVDEGEDLDFCEPTCWQHVPEPPKA